MTKTVKSTEIKTKIPLEYKLEDMLAIDTYTIKEGILVKKAIEIHSDANKKSFNGAFIDERKISLTGKEKIYILGDNLKLILKIMKFKISCVIILNIECHF